MFRKIIVITAVIVIGLPVLSIAAFLGLAAYETERFQKGDYPFAEASSFTSGGMTVKLERFLAHPILAEYQRFVIVEMAGRQSNRVEVAKDSGGGGRVDICRTSKGELLLSDRFQALLISISGEIRPLNDAYAARILPDGSHEILMSPETRPACAEPVGRFDTLERSGYGFTAE